MVVQEVGLVGCHRWKKKRIGCYYSGGDDDDANYSLLERTKTKGGGGGHGMIISRSIAESGSDIHP